MTISAPVMSRAKKQRVVIQWVTRTSAEWRVGVLVDARAEVLEIVRGSDAEPGVDIFSLLMMSRSQQRYDLRCGGF
jgi:hypothetical protein